MKKKMLILAVALSTACGKPSADNLALKAKAFFDQAHFQEAVIAYRQALEADPARDDLRASLGDAYMRARDPVNALKQYVTVADARPNDVAAQVRVAGLLVRARQFEAAEAYARKAIALGWKNPDALVVLGNALAGRKDLDGAVSEYQRALALNPSTDVAYTNIGTIHYSRGKLKDAEESFQQAVEVAPTSVPAHLALANFYLGTGRTKDAEQSLKNVLSIDASNMMAARALGILFLSTNRASEAEVYFKAIAQEANSAAGDLWLADYYITTQRFEEARPILRRLAAKEDNHAVAGTRLAALDAAEGDSSQALQALRDITAKYPGAASAHLLMARLLLFEGKRDEAIAEATAIITRDPSTSEASDAYLLVARIQASLDRPDDAIKAYQELLRHGTQTLAANVGLAQLYLSAGSVDKAATHAQQAVAIEPNSPEARTMMVRVHLAQDNKLVAQKELAQLEAEFPQSPAVLNLLASQQLSNGRTDAARSLYAKAAAASAGNLEATAGLIRIDLAGGRRQAAIARVDEAVKNPQVTSAFLVLAAQAYVAAGDSKKAEAALMRAITLEPGRLQAYSLLGGLYAMQKRLEEAGRQFRQVIEHDPSSVPANTMLGMLLEAQQRGPEAEKQYLKVLALDRQAVVAANNLAWLYVSHDRNLDEALDLAKTAQQRMPDEPHVNDTLGWIYYKQHNTPSAIRHLESSVRRSPNEPSVRFHLGMAYSQAGETDNAKRELERALAHKVEFEGAAEARRVLSQIGR